MDCRYNGFCDDAQHKKEYILILLADSKYNQFDSEGMILLFRIPFYYLTGFFLKGEVTLCEMCPNTGLLLVRIWTLFMQC